MPDDSNTRSMPGNATTGHKGGNPWHDPKSGRFTSGPAAVTPAQGNPPGDDSSEIVVTAPRFQTQGNRPASAPHVLPEDLLAAIKQTGALSLRLAELHAEHAADFRDILIKQYHQAAPLATALAASAELESGLDPSVTQHGKNGHGQGLFQLDVTPNLHPVAIRASASLLRESAGEARGCFA